MIEVDAIRIIAAVKIRWDPDRGQTKEHGHIRKCRETDGAIKDVFGSRPRDKDRSRNDDTDRQSNKPQL